MEISASKTVGKLEPKEAILGHASKVQSSRDYWVSDVGWIPQSGLGTFSVGLVIGFESKVIRSLAVGLSVRASVHDLCFGFGVINFKFIQRSAPSVYDAEFVD